MRVVTWASLKTSPISDAAPSWLQVLSAPRDVALMRYDTYRFTMQSLSNRWSADIDTVPPGETPPHRGDLICYVGKAGGFRGDVIWPPARVVDRRRLPDGSYRVTTLGDRALAPLPLAEMDEPLRRRLSPARGTLGWGTERLVLGLWSLDADCPVCGWIGNPLRFGLVAEPPPTGPESFDDPNDPGGAASDQGCVQEGGWLPRYECRRCGNQWPEPERVVHDSKQLLQAVEVSSIAELSAVLDANCDADAWVEEIDGGIEVRVAGRGILLAYPFYLFELWEVRDELEESFIEDAEAESADDD